MKINQHLKHLKKDEFSLKLSIVTYSRTKFERAQAGLQRATLVTTRPQKPPGKTEAAQPPAAAGAEREAKPFVRPQGTISATRQRSPARGGPTTAQPPRALPTPSQHTHQWRPTGATGPSPATTNERSPRPRDQRAPNTWPERPGVRCTLALNTQTPDTRKTPRDHAG